MLALGSRECAAESGNFTVHGGSVRIGQNRVCVAVGLMLPGIRGHGDGDGEDAHTVEGDRVGRQTVIAGGDCIRGKDDCGA